MATTSIRQEEPDSTEVNPSARTGGTPAPVYKVPTGRAVAGRALGRRYLNRASGRMESAQQMKGYHAPKPSRVPGSSSSRSSSSSTTRTTSTGVNRNAPYEPWASPYKTQGQFEQGAQQIAKTMYGPKLGMLGEEESGARNLYKERENENEQIYKAYTAQANQAMEAAKAALAGIASSTNAQGLQSQQLLNSALQGGPAGLGESPEAAKFLERAAQETGFTQQSLAQKQSSILGELANNAAQVPLAGRNEARVQENQTLQDTLAKLASERGRVAEEEPNDIAKARAELTKEEVNRAATRLQRELTGEKIGQEGELKREANRGKIDVAKINAEAKRTATGEKAKNEEWKRNHAADLEKKKNFASAVAYFARAAKVGKGEYQPGGTPQEEQGFREKNLRPHQGNAQQVYNTLTQVYKLSTREAWQVMKSGGGYWQKFVEDRERELKARRNSPLGKLPKSGPGTTIKSVPQLGELTKK